MSGGYSITHHAMYDLSDTRVRGIRFNTEPVGGKIIHRNHPHGVAGLGGVNVGRVPRDLILKSIVFGFGQSGHSNLLQIQQRVVLILAFHGMENKSSVLIYLMVDDFEQVAGAVNTNPQIFVLVAFPLHKAVIAVILKGVQNILPTDVMLECGFVKLDNDLLIHAFILPQKWRRNKPSSFRGMDNGELKMDNVVAASRQRVAATQLSLATKQSRRRRPSPWIASLRSQ
jgi:hypothetical protein